MKKLDEHGLENLNPEMTSAHLLRLVQTHRRRRKSLNRGSRPLQKNVGCLMYLALTSMPQIMFAASSMLLTQRHGTGMADNELA